MKRLLVVATSVVVLAAGGAFAGEVKGPPGTLNNTNETGALKHANSACAASGLNDFDLSDQTARSCRRFRPRRTPGSFTGFRTAPQAHSDSARAERGKDASSRYDLVVGPVFAQGQPASY